MLEIGLNYMVHIRSTHSLEVFNSIGSVCCRWKVPAMKFGYRYTVVQIQDFSLAHYRGRAQPWSLDLDLNIKVQGCLDPLVRVRPHL